MKLSVSMKFLRLFLPRRLFCVVVVILITAGIARPETQTVDARIEGFVADANGAVVPSVSVIAINLETGARGSSTSNESGIYRFSILTLGGYAIVVEHPGFKRWERRGLILSAGQTATIPIVLEPGSTQETVIINSDVPIADPSKSEIGSQINARDVTDLPLVSRNPFNFVLLQPATTGRLVNNPAVVQLSSNGLLRWAAYQLDGGYNNDSDVGGFRLSLISEVFLKEVQVLGSGYSAEFGNTAGTVVNMVTRSGTNDFHGTLAFLYRPASLASRPFAFKPGDPEANLNASGLTTAIGGPVLKDRWHFYTAYERTRSTVVQPITISEANRSTLVAAGLPASIFNNTPTIDVLPYFIIRTDASVTRSTRFSLRYNRFDSNLKNTGAGGLSSTERSFDRGGWDHSLAAQAVTAFSDVLMNEFRFTRVHRLARLDPGNHSAIGLSIDVANVANFGRSPNIGSVDTNLASTQFQNATTRVLDRHSVKFGGGVNVLTDNTLQAAVTRYTFPNIQSYVNAVSGKDRRAYSNYTETFGDPSSPFDSVFLSLFVVDDWTLTQRLKIISGLRYDLYRPPAGVESSPLPMSRSFTTDANNIAPRLAIAYRPGDSKYQTVLRAGSGIYFDPPFSRMYRRARRNNGDPQFFTFGFTPGDRGAPEFPNTLGTFPSGALIPRRNVDSVSPDFRTMYAVHSNLQIEQTISENMSATFGYLFSMARHIPVYRNVNCLPVGETLTDGRPVYGIVRNVTGSGTVQIETCTRPVLPEFRQVNMADSSGNLAYHAIFVQLAKRFANGFQANANYTYSHARDDGPEENGPSPVAQSDPSRRERDRGASWGDVRQTFRLSLVARPKFMVTNEVLSRLVNNNQVSLMAFADSGENFNVVAGFDLNRDGSGGAGPDRPATVGRNAFRLPAFFRVDLRVSRFITLSKDLALEIYGEASNVFNGKYVSSYNGTVLPASNLFTDAVNPITGELRGPIPQFDESQANWRESRQIQLGVRFHF
jgi:Carboxypeptidase regulatory-like domain